jgi:penicillin-binding protein 1C
MHMPMGLSQRRRGTALAVGLVLALVGLGGGVRAYLGPLPDLNDLDRYRPAASIRILDRQGLLLYEVVDPARGNYRPIPGTAMPLACRQAIVAVEDIRFYQHPGVDLPSILRAAWSNWRAGGIVQGGSTLTQQLARLLLFEEAERHEQSLRRKLREAVLAWRLERRFDKEDILTLYLNHVYFGHFAVGLEAAAQSYFGRHAAELDLAQCALLAGLPQAPVAYNPMEHREAARRRQRQVLARMVAAGFIDAATAERAAAEPLSLAPTPFPIEAPHFVFYVYGQLEEALGRERLAQGGLTVYTTLDLTLNRHAERIIRRRLAELNRPTPGGPLQRRAENAALVALDPATGALLALVGSPDYFDARIDGAVNAALALRQPGSAIKPLTYAVALDPNLSAAAGRRPFTPATILADVPSRFLTREGTYYQPLNYDLTFHGPTSVRMALANSYNVPAVHTLAVIGVAALVEQARRHGITTLGRPEDYGLALTLGGGEVRLLELTAAYGPFVTGGRPLHPIAIARIEDAQGRLLFAAGLDGPVFNPEGWPLPVVGQRPLVLDPRTAYLITHILSDNDARSRSFGFSSPLRLDRPAAAKTGTTTDWRDNWTIGYTPDLLTGVWVGNADNTPMYGVGGIDGAAPIWHDFMTVAHRGRPVRTFARPPGLVEQTVCLPSGLLPSPACPQIGRELFIVGTEPDRPDDQYRRIAVDVRTGQPATAATPATAVAYRVAWAPPPALRDWARQQGMLLLADESAAPTAISAQPELQIVSPTPDAVYVWDERLPPGAQRLQLAVGYHGRDELSAVTYLLDEAMPITVTGWPWTAWWLLTPGDHRLRVIARTREGRTLATETVRFRVEK